MKLNTKHIHNSIKQKKRNRLKAVENLIRYE